jgi:hypothetical protein
MLRFHMYQRAADNALPRCCYVLQCTRVTCCGSLQAVSCLTKQAAGEMVEGGGVVVVGRDTVVQRQQQLQQQRWQQRVLYTTKLHD